MLRDSLVESLRRTKLRLVAAGAIGQTCVPLVEVFEVWLTSGLTDVILRARRRLSGDQPRRIPESSIPADRDAARLSTINIPIAGERLVASIVIPVFNNAFLTHQCLSSITASTPEGTYEVIVVDNGSNLHTRNMLARVTGLRQLVNATNRGFVEACNQGAASANAPYVIFLNNDTAVTDGWLDALLRPFAQDPSVGAVGAKLVYPNGRLQEAGCIIWNDAHGWNYGRNGDPTAPEFNYVREVDYCSAACLAIPRPLFKTLGGFDGGYSPAYYEDVDLCFRLRKSGYRAIYQPEAVIVHYEGATAGTNLSRGLKRHQALNRITFLKRHTDALEAQYPPDPRAMRLARSRQRGPRILVVDHMVPRHDEDAGSVRMTALLHMFVELGYAVTFLPDDLAPAEPYTRKLQQIGVEIMYGPAGNGFVETQGEQFDIAILCRAHVAAKYVRRLLELSGRPSIVFDTVDLHYLREERQAALEKNTALAATAIWTRGVELDVMRSSDRVWATSLWEAALLHSSGDSLPPVDVVPTIHTVRSDAPPFEKRRNFLFIGGFRHAPNEDAVLYFVNDILPLVHRELPEATFVIIGSHMPPSIRNLASQRITVVGHVEDVTALFDASRLSVAPIRYGAGVKGKVTQSLALGLPVVATPVAAEGLDVVDGEHLAVAADSHSFARCLLDIYRNETRWNRLSVNGRRYIESRHGYETVKASIAAILEQL